MNEGELKAAEHRGYARGYNAGKKRKDLDRLRERMAREEQAFLDRAFLAALPAAIAVSGWEVGGKPIASLPDRVKLASLFAHEALKQRPLR